MNRDALKLAALAGVIGAAAEYPLARRFPLHEPLPVARRMLAAGALVAGSILIASLFVGRKGDQ
jgi:hypothetical protein